MKPDILLPLQGLVVEADLGAWPQSASSLGQTELLAVSPHLAQVEQHEAVIPAVTRRQSDVEATFYSLRVNDAQALHLNELFHPAFLLHVVDVLGLLPLG